MAASEDFFKSYSTTTTSNPNGRGAPVPPPPPNRSAPSRPLSQPPPPPPPAAATATVNNNADTTWFAPAPAPSKEPDIWFSHGQTPAPAPAPVQNPEPSKAPNMWFSHDQTPAPVQQPETQRNVPHNYTNDVYAHLQPAPLSNSGTELGMSGPLVGAMTPGINNNISSSTHTSMDFGHEPPLLEELGVNIPHILAKSRAVVLPFSRKNLMETDQCNLMDDDDLAGPLFFLLALGGEMLLAGKIHFGSIYGFGLFGCVCMALILNLMSPPDKPLSPWTVISILGYSLLPVNGLAAINVFIRIKYWVKFGVPCAALTIVWCTIACVRLFEKGFGMRSQRYLVAYPLSLLYSSFVILTIF